MKKLSKKEISWSLYDVASSGFIMLLTAIIPTYFRELINAAGIEQLANNPIVDFLFHQNVVDALAGNHQSFEALKTSLFSLSTAISVLVIAISAPFIGALADYPNKKKRLFGITLTAGIIGCFALATTTNWLVFLCIVIVVRILYNAINIFYDSMLVDVQENNDMDDLSSFGYAIGYIGSCIPFICSIILIVFKPWHLSSAQAVQISFVITALWWLIFSLPLLKNFKQKHYVDNNSSHLIKDVCTRLKSTLFKIKQNPKIFYFIIGYFCYIDGVYTIVNMATTYGAEVGINTNDMIIALLITQIVAFPCALITAKLAKKLSNLVMIKYLIITYIFICAYAYQMDKTFEFWVLCFLVGAAQGGIQALSRSYFASIIPKQEASEYFGFFDIFGKFADLFGPIIMTLSTAMFAQSKYGIICLVLLFLIGYACVSKVIKMEELQ